MNARRLIVIGAGPIGIAAALGGARRGWEVTVLESDDIGCSLCRWGPTRFFSPLGMNLPPESREILGAGLPHDDTILTGPEFRDSVLMPLARSEVLAGRIRTNHRVVAVGRSGLTRCDFPGHPIRGERCFRLLVDTPEGEKSFEAECVIDASGIYGQPVALGAGGIPAAGERSFSGTCVRDLGALHARLNALRGKRILLLGHGHSAANAILVLAAIAEESPSTRVVWATRSFNQRPCVEVASDPLQERQHVVAHANQLAARPPAWLKMERRASVGSVSDEKGAFRVVLGGGRIVVVGEVVALTGYRPDLSFLSELAIEIAPATERKCAPFTSLIKPDRLLSVPSVKPEDLYSGELGFYLAGAKSYGRARTFLLKNGYVQLGSILDDVQSKGQTD